MAGTGGESEVVKMEVDYSAEVKRLISDCEMVCMYCIGSRNCVVFGTTCCVVYDMTGRNGTKRSSRETSSHGETDKNGLGKFHASTREFERILSV